ncbi:Alpha/Beta hydrolase protein [Dactylonectria macrodidyma]|uniref:Alpha/Beta hydrolase protein n=1 Tax=Dactylonectria macrodidyma TaxID=307937 RepID=A0A9P9I7N9_9HYPO|nr:Alpha/Beta hydrolase protein [Dactylonectria macrodidyma]
MAKLSTGVVVDIVGLTFSNAGVTGTVADDGTFQYDPNHVVVFSIGPLQLASTQGKPSITFLDFIADAPATDNPKLINRARLLLSLSDGLGFEKKVVITEKIRTILSRYASRIDLDSPDLSALDAVLLDIGKNLSVPPKTVPHARNQIRRAMAGFKVLRDVKVPLRDGHFVYADIYLPLSGQGRYPVLLANTIYGKRVVYSGPDLSLPVEVAEFERAEDEWFTTPSAVDIRVPHTTPTVGRWAYQRRFETTSSFNTFLWVPRGYVMVKIDPRGVGQTPGTRNVPGQETSDICDAIEWAADQPWSTGSVGLSGSSYGANVQWPVAALKPKGLKCFVPFATDIDQYRDIAYQGGISHAGYLKKWLAGVQELSPKWPDTGYFYGNMEAHPFDDAFWEGEAVDFEKIDIPVFIAASQVALVHSRGPFEAWRRVTSKHKYLEMVDGNYYSWPNHECASKVLAFTERYLKGNLTELETVGLQMRLGHKEWYWRTESDWEVPSTEYVKWYLGPDQRLSQDLPSAGKAKLSYSAQEIHSGPQAGISFVSDPLTEDVELLGHFAAKLHLSSTTQDADVIVHIWALDEKDNVVSFCLRDTVQPLNSGCLRASHRKLDSAKTLPWRPFHTHLQQDHAPLQNGEIAELDVELFPASARLKAGWKIRVDVCPSDHQPNVPGFNPPPYRIHPKELHEGVTNTLHFGDDHENYVILPKVPLLDLASCKPLESLEY